MRACCDPCATPASCAAASQQIREVNFAEQRTGRIYLMIATGSPVWADHAALETAMANPETRAGLIAVVPLLLERALPGGETPRYLAEQSATSGLVTLGAWGP